MATEHPDVLVVGAGPVGLTLALQAVLHGARVRLIDSRPGLWRPSRALIMHPRTAEVLRPLGVVERILAHGTTALDVDVHIGSPIGTVNLGDLAISGTAFPFLSVIRQADVEQVLAQALLERGVNIDWRTRFLGLDHDVGLGHGDSEVRATVRTPGGDEIITCQYLVGCDGAASSVRGVTGICWNGKPYRHEVVIADLELADNDATGKVLLGRSGTTFLLPVGEFAPWRLMTTRACSEASCPPGQFGPPVHPDELAGLCEQAGVPVTPAQVRWSSRARVQHRLAERFRSGRVFLAGDAAHSHSPAGALGMNTGIQDATNLGWKLALASTTSPSAALLDSYETERRPIARRVIAATDLLYWLESDSGPLPAALRTRWPRTAAAVLRVSSRNPWLIGSVIAELGNLNARYRPSPFMSPSRLCRDADAGLIGRRLGDRHVVIDGHPILLHELLAQPGIHVLAAGHPQGLTTWSGRYPVHLHSVENLAPGRLLGVRPDGYVGCHGDEAALTRWFDHLGLEDQSKRFTPESRVRM